MQHDRQARAAYTVAEAAAQLSLGRTKMAELIASNQVRHVRVGRRVLVPRAALDEFLERRADE
jgi:excisionase family DNA binding protein